MALSEPSNDDQRHALDVTIRRLPAQTLFHNERRGLSFVDAMVSHSEDGHNNKEENGREVIPQLSINATSQSKSYIKRIFKDIVQPSIVSVTCRYLTSHVSLLHTLTPPFLSSSS